MATIMSQTARIYSMQTLLAEGAERESFYTWS